MSRQQGVGSPLELIMRELLLWSSLLKELLCLSLEGSLFGASIQIGRSKGLLKHMLAGGVEQREGGFTCARALPEVQRSCCRVLSC